MYTNRKNESCLHVKTLYVARLALQSKWGSLSYSTNGCWETVFI